MLKQVQINKINAKVVALLCPSLICCSPSGSFTMHLHFYLKTIFLFVRSNSTNWHTILETSLPCCSASSTLFHFNLTLFLLIVFEVVKDRVTYIVNGSNHTVCLRKLHSLENQCETQGCRAISLWDHNGVGGWWSTLWHVPTEASDRKQYTGAKLSVNSHMTHLI